MVNLIKKTKFVSALNGEFEMKQKKQILWYFLIVILLTLVSCVKGPSPHQPGMPHHHTVDGFRNPEGSPERSFSWHALWFLPTRPFAQLFESEVPEGHVINESQAVQAFYELEDQNTITWIGHMTAVIRLDHQIIVIDPWFTDYATPFPPFGPHRKMPPGIGLHQLPQIDTVIVSHNHYDHYDIETLEQLPNPEKITLVVPLKLGQYVEHVSFKQVIELDWYQATTVQGVTYTALPMVHFSARGLSDTNETLWAGFSIHGLQSNKKLFFFEGDYGEIYKKIGQDYGPFDIAMIASGAYEPRSLMKGAHCSPKTCVQAGRDLQANVLIPFHWGTTVLGSEGIYETGALFQKAAIAQGLDPANVWIMKIGETRKF